MSRGAHSAFRLLRSMAMAGNNLNTFRSLKMALRMCSPKETFPFLAGLPGRASHVPSHARVPSRALAVPSDFNVMEGVAEESRAVRIDAYDETGFTVNGVDFSSSILCVGSFAAHWSPKSMAQISPDSLALFELLQPRPELLILGSGRTVQQISPEIRGYVKSLGIKLEAIPSRNAASTFNILSEEGRQVAAVLLPHSAE